MPVVVEFHPEAVAEARAARRWYAERGASAATAFVGELDAAVASLAEAPDRWPRYVHDTRRCPFRRFPYYLVYRKQGDVLQILAVAHGRKRPGYWRSRR